MQCFGSGSFCPAPDQAFFPESGSESAKNPDPRNHVIRNKSFASILLVLFWINIRKKRTDPGLDVRIRIGEKTRIHPDPEHWLEEHRNLRARSLPDGWFGCIWFCCVVCLEQDAKLGPWRHPLRHGAHLLEDPNPDIHILILRKNYTLDY